MRIDILTEGRRCTCGADAEVVWDAADGPRQVLCARCYLARAKQTIRELYEETGKDRLVVLASTNFLRGNCHDCGVRVPARAGFRAWVTLHAQAVTLCDACTNERMRELHESSRYF